MQVREEPREHVAPRLPLRERVVGIAPRTSVDRTNQMPDDPIIRY